MISVDVPAGELQDASGRSRVRQRLLAGHPHQCAPGAVGLEAAEVAAPALDAVGDHRDVADLAAHAEPTAHQLAVDDHAAADAGADREHQQVLDVLAGAERELAPGGGVGVVLHDDRQVELLLEVIACSGSSRQARLGAKTTIARSLSTNPAAQTPTASTSFGPDERADELADRAHDLGRVGGR